MKISSIIFMGLMAASPIHAKEPKPCARGSLNDFINVSRSFSHQSMNSVTPAGKVHTAKNGIEWAEECVGKYPKEAGCYFYRAVNRGLYYQAASLRYQKGLKKIIRDCDKVIEIDPGYDDGGAYRLLGNIFLHVPSFSLAKRAITRDLDKASLYAEKAYRISADHLDNRLLLAQVLFEQEKYDEALRHLRYLLPRYPRMQPYTWHDKRNFEKAQKLMARAEKRLTKGK